MSAQIKVESPPNVYEFADPDLLARCLDAFKEASGGAAATVKLTEDFDADVGRASAHQPRAVEYRSDRGALGVVGGRTILRPDGEIEVYVNLASFLDLKDDEAVVSLFQHEGFHVAIDSRGESLWSRATSADARLPEEPHEHCFQAAAAACDEYRVEFGVARDDRSVDDFLDFADSCEILIARASLRTSSTTRTSARSGRPSRNRSTQWSSGRDMSPRCTRGSHLERFPGAACSSLVNAWS
jgi:hypothetical protein